MTSSEQDGSLEWGTGKYAVKVYTIDGVLIYQAENGTTNTGKTPKGGVIAPGSIASSMLDAIANPITYYAGSNRIVINQEGHSGDLYNYYWTSYSRGTDGQAADNGVVNNSNWHNVYLDGYIPLRIKSIYDPCPYSYRISSNGTYNQFSMQSGWTIYSYLGGVSWDLNTLGTSWLVGLGNRYGVSGIFENAGRYCFYTQSTAVGQTIGYSVAISSGKTIYLNYVYYTRSYGQSVRCIEN